VLAQSGVKVRVVVIDDASSDHTARVGRELVASDNRVKFRRHEANRGHIATCNGGIEWASEEYMLLLSADDYVLPGALSRSAELMDAHPEVGFAFGKSILLKELATETETVANAAAESVVNGATCSVLTGS
jgi:glycosyltransferase involved in cell wall biosynthesis